MKKFTAVLVAVLLMVSVLAFSVSAEGFVFTELRRDDPNGMMKVEWNHTEAGAGDELEDVLLGGRSMPFSFDDQQALWVDTTSLDAGVYSVVYEYVSGAQQGEVTASDFVKGGEAEVTLSAVINDNGTVTITAVNGSGAPVPEYELGLVIGNMSVSGAETDKNGQYTSRYMLGYDQAVIFEGKESRRGIVVYGAVASQSLVRRRPVTTTVPTTTVPTTTVTQDDSAETTTTVTETTTTGTETTTTVPTTLTTAIPEDNAVQVGGKTNASVLGAGTTAVDGDKIVLNASTDTGILGLFGCNENTFGAQARLYVSQSDYNKLVGRTDNRLMLNVLTSSSQVSETQIAAAVKDVAALSAYGADRTAVTFDLAFLILDKTGNVVPVSAVPIGSTYIVELPVPASMANCEKLAITMMDGGTLAAPIEVKNDDGTFKMVVNSLEPFTLIGFGTDSGKTSSVSSLAVVLFIVGGVLLVGAAVLLYFFVFRKPTPAPAVGDTAPQVPTVAESPVDDGDDIFSGRTDLPPSGDGDNP